MPFIESGMAPGKDLCRERIASRWTHEQKNWVRWTGVSAKETAVPQEFSIFLICCWTEASYFIWLNKDAQLLQTSQQGLEYTTDSKRYGYLILGESLCREQSSGETYLFGCRELQWTFFINTINIYTWARRKKALPFPSVSDAGVLGVVMPMLMTHIQSYCTYISNLILLKVFYLYSSLNNVRQISST